jgi:hypothetical protein
VHSQKHMLKGKKEVNEESHNDKKTKKKETKK